MGDLDDSQVLRPEKLAEDNPWRDKFRRWAKEKTVQQLRYEAGVSARVVESWIGTGECNVPRFDTLRRVEAGLKYRLVDQLVDLGLVDPNEVTTGFAALPASASLALGRLEHVVLQLTRSRYDVWTLAQAVTDSCVATGHPGRWRARLFDLPAGHKFPYVSHRAVEFMRARIPGEPELGSPDDIAKTRDLLLELVPDEGAWSSLAFRRTEANHGHWLDRVELRARMAGVWDLMVANITGGGGGSLHHALVNNPSQDMRHIVLDVAGSMEFHEPRETIPVNSALTNRGRESASEYATPRKVLLIAPPSAAGLAIVRMVAEALGWRSESVRERSAAMTGQRLVVATDSVGGGELGGALSHVARWRPESAAILSLSSIPSAVSSLNLSGLQELLDDTDTLPVLLRPHKQALAAWQARQELGVGPIGSVSANSRSADVEAAMLFIESLLKRSGKIWVSAVMTPVLELPWKPDLPVAKQSYIDPLIGDYVVRASYQLAHLFALGNQGSSRGDQRKLFFKDGSVLSRYQDSLRLRDETRLRPLRIGINNAQRQTRDEA